MQWQENCDKLPQGLAAWRLHSSSSSCLCGKRAITSPVAYHYGTVTLQVPELRRLSDGFATTTYTNISHSNGLGAHRDSLQRQCAALARHRFHPRKLAYGTVNRTPRQETHPHPTFERPIRFVYHVVDVESFHYVALQNEPG
eukprot:6324062-Amphidinium_carterae.1